MKKSSKDHKNTKNDSSESLPINENVQIHDPVAYESLFEKGIDKFEANIEDKNFLLDFFKNNAAGDIESYSTDDDKNESSVLVDKVKKSLKKSKCDTPNDEDKSQAIMDKIKKSKRDASLPTQIDEKGRDGMKKRRKVDNEIPSNIDLSKRSAKEDGLDPDTTAERKFKNFDELLASLKSEDCDFEYEQIEKDDCVLEPKALSGMNEKNRKNKKRKN